MQHLVRTRCYAVVVEKREELHPKKGEEQFYFKERKMISKCIK